MRRITRYKPPFLPKDTIKMRHFCMQRKGALGGIARLGRHHVSNYDVGKLAAHGVQPFVPGTRCNGSLHTKIVTEEREVE